MKFYTMKLKPKVDVPDKDIKKTVFQQKGSRGGSQRRHALVAEMNGTRMFKVVNEATFNSMQVPETT